MKQEIYDYLNNYGFDDMEIDEIVSENKSIENASLTNMKENIEFLEKLKIQLDDIICGTVANPILLTVSNERLVENKKIYENELKLSDSDLCKMFNDNYESLSISTKKLESIVDYLNDDLSNDEIKELFLNNARLLSLSLDEFKNAVNI